MRKRSGNKFATNVKSLGIGQASGLNGVNPFLERIAVAVDVDRPSTWLKYETGRCHGCRADCCRLPVEATMDDLVRLGLVSPDEARGSPKKIARELGRQGFVKSWRAKSGFFMMEQTPSGDCLFLGKDRLCTVYDKRPDVCRKFPSIGPRPGYCPSRKKLPQ